MIAVVKHLAFGKPSDIETIAMVIALVNVTDSHHLYHCHEMKMMIMILINNENRFAAKYLIATRCAEDHVVNHYHQHHQKHHHNQHHPGATGGNDEAPASEQRREGGKPTSGAGEEREGESRTKEVRQGVVFRMNMMLVVIVMVMMIILFVMIIVMINDQ